MLFSQGSISSAFTDEGGIDDTIEKLLRGEIDPDQIPDIQVFLLDGKLYSINNRRLFMWRVLAFKGFLSSITAILLQRSDPLLQRRRFDEHRLHVEAPKWERHLSSTTGGHVVRVTGPGSKYVACQVSAPCREWRLRLNVHG